MDLNYNFVAPRSFFAKLIIPIVLVGEHMYNYNVNKMIRKDSLIIENYQKLNKQLWMVCIYEVQRIVNFYMKISMKTIRFIQQFFCLPYFLNVVPYFCHTCV